MHRGYSLRASVWTWSHSRMGPPVVARDMTTLLQEWLRGMASHNCQAILLRYRSVSDRIYWIAISEDWSSGCNAYFHIAEMGLMDRAASKERL